MLYYFIMIPKPSPKSTLYCLVSLMCVIVKMIRHTNTKNKSNSKFLLQHQYVNIISQFQLQIKLLTIMQTWRKPLSYPEIISSLEEKKICASIFSDMQKDFEMWKDGPLNKIKLIGLASNESKKPETSLCKLHLLQGAV